MKPQGSRPIYYAVGFGLTAFVIAFSLGTVLTASTGVPLAGGLLNGVLTAMVLTIGLKTTRFTGAATLMWLVFSLPAIITTTLGPPGAYKVVIAIIAGGIWDLFYTGFHYRARGLYLGGIFGALAIMFALLGFLALGFGDDAQAALTRYRSFLWPLLAINVTVTATGIWLGDRLHSRRLSKLAAFKFRDDTP